MKLRLQIPTTVASDGLFVINSTDVGNVQVRSTLIKSSMIGKTICGRVIRTANMQMGCEWQLEDIISIEKSPSSSDIEKTTASSVVVNHNSTVAQAIVPQVSTIFIT